MEYLYDLTTFDLALPFFPKDERQLKLSTHETYLFKLYSLIKTPNIVERLGMNAFRATSIIESRIGRFYFYYKYNNKKALEFFKKVLQTVNDGHLGEEEDAWSYIGDVYKSENQYEKALEAYSKALKYSKKRKSQSQMNILCEIAAIHYLMGNEERGLKEYTLAESISIPNDSDIWEINKLYVLQSFLAKNYYDNKRYKDAIRYYDKAVINCFCVVIKGLKSVNNLPAPSIVPPFDVRSISCSCLYQMIE